MNRILFVCTGNTCRSPMAESLLRKLAQERGIEVEVKSAGVAAWNGTSMSEHAAQVLKQYDASNDSFQSTSVNQEDIQWADLVLTLTVGHKQQVLYQFPEMTDKTYTLKEYVLDHKQAEQAQQALQALIADLQLKLSLGTQPTEEERAQLIELQRQCPNLDISDPFGGSLEQYQATAAEIRAMVELLLDKLAKK
ncbi:low molecular weight protein arginine phosphatase [Paenibacillus sp. 481]|uniref:low molecular weight protein arginine phosphatase n=1 Tax=Paenibacillus sp. 481 TaxID=2835869 RepID=UPI001E548C82|nr:low molecular weight protein arginine phosphatase [Paenibacillus sp. 481]UHA76027.1 low molecular weight protein arginine phosphatase [Paenibacillus sp. 481]